MQYKINLVANVPLRQELQGKTFVLVSTGAAPTIDLKIEIQGFANEEMRGVKSGFKLNAPGFTSCLLTAPVNCTVEVVTSFADISINTNEGASVQATIVNLPLAVVPDRGAPANPVYVSGITYNDAPATSLTNAAPVAAGPGGVVVMAANASRKAARFLNLGPDPVAIGGAGLTWAQRTLVLNLGDVWNEERGANVAWSAICETAKTASVTVQEVLS